jgi:hypothetical protein
MMPAEGRHVPHSTRLALFAILPCAGLAVAGCPEDAFWPAPARAPTTGLDAAGSEAEPSPEADADAGTAPTSPDAAGPGIDATESDREALPLCSGGGPGWFSSDPLNRVVIEDSCAPAGFSGTGRVTRIWRSERDGSILTIDVVLPAQNACGGESPPTLNILHPVTDWGLAVGSRLQVEVVATSTDFHSRTAAVIRSEDGSLLAAYFDHREDALAPFLARLPFDIQFELDCQILSTMSCFRKATFKSLVLPLGRTRLRSNESTRVPHDGATFYLALGHATAISDYDPRIHCTDPPGPGFRYHFFLHRLPSPLPIQE